MVIYHVDTILNLLGLCVFPFYLMTFMPNFYIYL